MCVCACVYVCVYVCGCVCQGEGIRKEGLCLYVCVKKRNESPPYVCVCVVCGHREKVDSVRVT